MPPVKKAHLIICNQFRHNKLQAIDNDFRKYLVQDCAQIDRAKLCDQLRARHFLNEHKKGFVKEILDLTLLNPFSY